MTYADVLVYLESRINYERRGMPNSRELRLDRMALLLDRLGTPQRRYPIVHIAGTKGKGSTAHMVAQFLHAAGQRVGLHCSPHLCAVEERICLDGQTIDPATFTALVAEVVPVVRAVDTRLEPRQPPLTYFEVTTALALLYFARTAVDWAVVEVGMGGRLDATNVVDPVVSVITTISKDHTRQLGNTLTSIAGEKAGIIKSNRPVVSGVLPAEPAEVIRLVAQRHQCVLRELGRDFDFNYRAEGSQGSIVEVTTWRRRWPPMPLSLLGAHQAANCAVATAVIDVLGEQGLPVEPAKLGPVLGNLSLPGRIEVVGRHPVTVLDAAHNPASVHALVETLRAAFPRPPHYRGQRILIFSCSRDKEWQPMLAQLAREFDTIIVTAYQNNPRVLPPDELAASLEQYGVPYVVAPRPLDAWRVACQLAAAEGHDNPEAANDPLAGESLICVCGSFFLIAELEAVVRRAARDG